MNRLVLAGVLALAVGATLLLGAGAAPASSSLTGKSATSPAARAAETEDPGESGPESNYGSVANLGDAGFMRVAATNGGTEPSIAVDPSNVNNIAIMSGFGGWNGNASIALSTDGGNTWTLQNSIPQPPGAGGTAGCPCDQQGDYGRDGTFYGTFLSFTPTDVYTGSSSNLASAASWQWFTTGTPAVAQLTNAAAGSGNSDQPWLVTAPNPANLAQDNVYVAYDDFTVSPVGMHVATSSNARPPNFGVNVNTGAGGGGINPGHRLAADKTTGVVYDLFQRFAGAGDDSSKNINYMLNRSTDGGNTWTLNGSATGWQVANADSDQPTAKFGSTNALLGGVDHLAVDSSTGEVYVAYGDRDSATNNNRISVARLQDDGSGNMIVASTSFLTGQVQAALPSVAVASNGTVGVLYDTFDGFTPSTSLPIFTAHLAQSTDHGATWNDRMLETFTDPNTDSGNARQRDLGDYQELNAVGRTFYGVFSGNQIPLGGSTAQINPIFFKAIADGGPIIQVSGDLNFGNVPKGSSVTRDVTIQNGGDRSLLVNSVGFGPGTNSDYSIVSNPGAPQLVQPGGSLVYQVRFTPTSGGTKSGTLVIQDDDAAAPTVTLPIVGAGLVGKIAVSGSLDFGTVARGSSSTRSITVHNTGGGPLLVSSVALAGGSDPAFSVGLFPGTPQTLAPGSSIQYDVTFAPPASATPGLRTGTLNVSSDDSTNPLLAIAAKGIVGTSKAGLDSTELDFGAVPVDNRTAPHSRDEVVGVNNAASCGGCDLNVTALSFGGANPGDFSLVGPPSLPAAVGAGSHLSLKVRFNPPDAGPRSATLTITTDDPANPTLVVNLSGEGLLPKIAAPATVVFGPTVYDPVCVIMCGTSQTVNFTNTGQAELIADTLSFSGSPAFSGPGPASPPDRFAPTSTLSEEVTFHPTAPARKLTGSLLLRDELPFDTPKVGRSVDFCGESVGRGIRVLVADTAGNVIPSLTELHLQSTGTSPNVNINLKDVGVTTINPPTSCQQIRFHYENQLLPSTEETAPKSSYYTLNVSAGGNRRATITFILGPQEFKQIVMTVDTVPPTIFGPASFSVFAKRSGGARVHFRVRAIDDKDGRVPVACKPKSGSFFRVGKTRVTCSAHDLAGNKAKYRFRVVVKRRHHAGH
jgi:hypothetical protein